MTPTEDFAVDPVVGRGTEGLRAQPLNSPTLPPLLLQEDTKEEETNDGICPQCGKPYPCQAQP